MVEEANDPKSPDCLAMLEEAKEKLAESNQKFEKAVELRQNYSTALVSSKPNCSLTDHLERVGTRFEHVRKNITGGRIEKILHVVL